jgi:hypothetical protein
VGSGGLERTPLKNFPFQRAWNWAYAEPKLIPWLFKMKRSKPPKPKNGAAEAPALLW